MAFVLATLLWGPVVLATVPYGQHGGEWNTGACNSRDRQSPINFFTKFKLPPLERFQYRYRTPLPENLTLHNSGGGLVIDVPPGAGHVTYQQKDYELTQIAFHSESEHSFRGQRFPLEVQLLHRRPGSAKIIAVAVMFKCVGTLFPPDPSQPIQESAHVVPSPTELDFNANLQHLVENALPGPEERSEVPVDFDLNGLLADGSFLSYAGSLTAPPCLETVTWFVRREIQLASTSQLKVLHTALYAMSTFGNYRTAMPLNNRPVLVYRATRSDPSKPHTAQWPLPAGPNPRTDEELSAYRAARQAQLTAQESLDYLHSLDERLRRASLKRSNILRRPGLEVRHTSSNFTANITANITGENGTMGALWNNGTILQRRPLLNPAQPKTEIAAAREYLRDTMATVSNDLRQSVMSSMRDAVQRLVSRNVTVTPLPLEYRVLPWTVAPKVLGVGAITTPPSPWLVP